MTKKSTLTPRPGLRSMSRSNSKLSDKLSNLNRSARSSKSKSTRKLVPNTLNLDPIPEVVPFVPVAPVPVQTPLKVYRGKSKKVFTRNSWPVPRPIAYITSTTEQMRNTRTTQGHLREELHYTRLLRNEFPFILNAEEITEKNEERVREGEEINENSSTLSRFFVYKKERVEHATSSTPGIFQFMVDSIFTMSHIMNLKHFAYLDMKPDNIGIKINIDGTTTTVLLDNGPDLCYEIDEIFISYFQEASIIVGTVCLRRPLTDEELQYLRDRSTATSLRKITPQLIIAAFHRRLYKPEKDRIIANAERYYNNNGMPLTAATMKRDLMFPREVINHYCRIDEDAAIEHRRERIRHLMNFTRLAQL
jgi:hypothetical protein